MRPITCELVGRLSGVATNTASASPSTTTMPTPLSTHRIEDTTSLSCPVTMPHAMPRIGVPSGAMIMAPITVAVESVSTPAIAITPDSVSMMRNPERLLSVSPALRLSASSSVSAVNRCERGISVCVSRDMAATPFPLCARSS